MWVRNCFELTSRNAIYKKARRISPSHDEIVLKEIDPVLSAGIITPVESSLESAVVIPTKKDGSLSFFVDHWKLNSVLHTDC